MHRKWRTTSKISAFIKDGNAHRLLTGISCYCRPCWMTSWSKRRFGTAHSSMRSFALFSVLKTDFLRLFYGDLMSAAVACKSTWGFLLTIFFSETGAGSQESRRCMNNNGWSDVPWCTHWRQEPFCAGHKTYTKPSAFVKYGIKYACTANLVTNFKFTEEYVQTINESNNLSL